jgi:hypothetical protein
MYNNAAGCTRVSVVRLVCTRFPKYHGIVVFRLTGPYYSQQNQ